MFDRLRLKLGTVLIKTGMRVVPPSAARLARMILLYHVPGGLDAKEKAEIEETMSELQVNL